MQPSAAPTATASLAAARAGAGAGADAQAGPPCLALEALDTGYAGRVIVSGLSLRLAPGAIGCLLGPSGCGKTTVLRAIAGFEPVLGGLVRLDGEPIARAGWQLPPERRRIGMVFQDLALFPHLTVAQNVAFGLRGHPDAARRTARLLDTVGLGTMARRHPHELSGGQQQRVALARALAPAPRLLLLDEPFSSLDADLRERLGGELRALLKAEGTTALLVTHDQHEAYAIADEIGILSGGRLQQWDIGTRVYQRPANRFVAGFLGDGALLPGHVVDGLTARVELGPVRGTSPLRCAEDGRALAVGEAIDLLVRPQHILIDEQGPAQARLVGRAFRGAHVLYTLQLPQGARVQALAPATAMHEPGTTLGLRLAPHELVAYRRAEAGSLARAA